MICRFRIWCKLCCVQVVFFYDPIFYKTILNKQCLFLLARGKNTKTQRKTMSICDKFLKEFYKNTNKKKFVNGRQENCHFLFCIFFLTFIIRTAGTTKYIPMFNRMILIPYPSISDSESMSAYCNNVSDVNRGVNVNLTASLKAGFSLS